MGLSGILGFLACGTVAGSLCAAADDASKAALQDQIDRLQKTLEQVKEESGLNKRALMELKSQNGDQWLTRERAAQIREIVQDAVADAGSRSSLESSGATSGYNNGFFLSSPDGNFKLVLNAQLQIRYAVSRLSGASLNGYAPANGVQRTARGFEVRRAKLGFTGNVVDPSWTFYVLMIYDDRHSGAGATGLTSPTAGSGATVANAALEDAWINKDLGNGFGVQVGQFKSPFIREELVSSRYQQCVERSLVNQLFSTKYTQGVAFSATGDNLMGVISFNDGGNDANTSAVIGNTNLSSNSGFTQYALTGRAQFLALGNWGQFMYFTSPRGGPQGLLIGGAFNWQRGGVGDGTAPVNGNGDAAMLTYTADAQWMLGGANLFGSFFGNYATGIAAGTPATTDGSQVLSYGATLQGGYYLSDSVEAFGRFEWYDTLNNGSNGMQYAAPGSAPTSNPFSAQHNTIYTVGVNWYISGQKIKLMMDLGYAVNGVVFTNGFFHQNIAGANYRQDSAVGNGGQFVFRTQLQLLF